MKTRSNISGFTPFRISVFPILALALGLAACSKTPEDTKESLARDPERLKQVREQCRTNPKSGEDKLCLAAAEAVRQRFFDPKSVQTDPSPTKSPADSAANAPKF